MSSDPDVTVPEDVLVVGATTAGVDVLDALRARGYRGRLRLLSAAAPAADEGCSDPARLCAGPGLPGGAVLQVAPRPEDLGAHHLHGDRAVGFHVASRTVRTAAGQELSPDAVVFAVGSRAPSTGRLGDLRGVGGVRVVHTLRRARELRAVIDPDSRWVVAGDGLFAVEVAAMVRQGGAHVTVVTHQSTPVEQQLGSAAAAVLQSLHERHGVRFSCGRAVERITQYAERATGVLLDDGRHLVADVVVLADDPVPATQWLRATGLLVQDADAGGGADGTAIGCDAGGRAAAGVYAVADAARWYHPGLRRGLRLPGRIDVQEQADVVAANVLGGREQHAPLPTWSSRQFGTVISVLGLPPVDAQVDVVESVTGEDGFVAVLSDGGTPRAVIGWNAPERAESHRGVLLPAFAPASTSGSRSGPERDGRVGPGGARARSTASPGGSASSQLLPGTGSGADHGADQAGDRGAGGGDRLPRPRGSAGVEAS